MLIDLLTNIGLWTQVALGIGLVIFVHELGHFVAAKTFGVKCEKFYVGFDPPIRIGPIKFPRTLGKFTYGETEYGIGIIPLGGYVKMLGQDDDPRNLEQENERIRVNTGEQDADAPIQLDPRSYPAKPVWQRMIIISAGVVMNVVTGIIFAAIAFGYGVTYTPAIVGGVTPGGPAWQAGVQPGGQVMSVDDYQAENMHFREMQTEVLHAGLDHPNEPIKIAIKYDDQTRQFALLTHARPDETIIRMVGISNPFSTKLSDTSYADPGSVAAEVLTEQDAGAEVIAVNGVPIDTGAIVPGSPLFDRIYSEPTQPIALTLRRKDKTEIVVDLPPQKAKSIGLRYSVGPITALVKDGPAEQAGMQIGDVITRVGEDQSPDPFELATRLVSVTETVTLQVQREGDEVELSIHPVDALQTVPPTESISGDLAINSVGFAYQGLPVISAIDRPTTSNDGSEPLQVGDTIQEVRLLIAGDGKPDWMQDQRYARAFDELVKGWSFSSTTPLVAFRETLQALPIGTALQVHATRPPDGRVVTSIVTVGDSDQYTFRRGIVLEASQAVQRAGSLTEAFSLGMVEGGRRFQEVLRFLGNLPRGQIKLRHVGGPLEIVNIAKQQAEKGISPQLMFLTFLSMNLAILNFLPIPALDGGHMVFLLYELIAGKRANEQLEFRLTLAGLLTLLTLMIVVFANDIMRHL